VTAAAGDQPASSSGLMKAPEVAKDTEERTIVARPTDVDDNFNMVLPAGNVMS
jgi:hypothetical protein